MLRTIDEDEKIFTVNNVNGGREQWFLTADEKVANIICTLEGAKDVAEWIEERDGYTVSRKVDEDEKVIHTICVSGQTREMTFLTEDGLYEVLPQIKQVDNTPDQYEEELPVEANKTELQIVDEREVLGRDFKIYGTVDEPLFLAKDVANWIENKNVSQMLNVVDNDEKLIYTLYISGQTREAWFLTEDGLYEVLMQSRKPIAKAFKKEVKKILKQIRQTGGYVPVSQEDDEEAILAKALVIAERTLNKKNKIIKELQPRANWFDDFMNSEGSYTSTQVAKLLNISSAKRLNKLLYESLKS